MIMKMGQIEVQSALTAAFFGLAGRTKLSVIGFGIHTDFGAGDIDLDLWRCNPCGTGGGSGHESNEQEVSQSLIHSHSISCAP